MKKLRVWILATLWFASVSGLSTYGVLLAREAQREKDYGCWGDIQAPHALHAYLGVQGAFQRMDRYGKGDLRYANPIDGTGLGDLYRIGGPDGCGPVLKFIDLAFARATTPATARYGYWYVDIVGDAVTGKPYDYTNECGLCAVPAVYGKTGINTYVIDLCCSVYAKDTHGTPVRVFPDVANEGWKRLDW